MPNPGEKLSGKAAIETFSNCTTRNALLLAILIVLVLLYFHIARKVTAVAEKFAAASYSAGASQRFQQINTDPTLGQQFGPYNEEIEARKALLGHENLTSTAESPVIFNYGRDDRDFRSPRSTSTSIAARRAREAGLSNTGDSAVNGEGTPQDAAVEDLIADLYA